MSVFQVGTTASAPATARRGGSPARTRPRWRLRMRARETCANATVYWPSPAPTSASARKHDRPQPHCGILQTCGNQIRKRYGISKASHYQALWATAQGLPCLKKNPKFIKIIALSMASEKLRTNKKLLFFKYMPSLCKWRMEALGLSRYRNSRYVTDSTFDSPYSPTRWFTADGIGIVNDSCGEVLLDEVTSLCPYALTGKAIGLLRTKTFGKN